MIKNFKLLTLLLVLTLFNCSIDRDETLVIEGIDGKNTLVGITNLIEGSEGCPSGGLRLNFGLDLDDDKILDDNEITQTAYVCNGADGENGANGTSALLEVTVIEPSDEYPNGGVLVTNGYDLNGNGTLEENEIASTTVIENGANGQNGVNSLIRTNRITDSEICALGGILIESGSDTNGNGVLDDSEVDSSQTATVCDGEDGKSLAVRVEFLNDENQYCGNGGYLLLMGVDQNGNEVLDDSEETVSFPICNGNNGINGTNGLSIVTNTVEIEGGTLVELYIDIDNNGDYTEGDELVNTFTVLNGQDGEDGLRGPQGPVGSQGIQGEQGPAGPKGNNGQDGVNAYQILSSAITINGVTTVTFYQDINDNGIIDQGDLIINEFILNDGTNGQNGETPIVTYEVIDEGTTINNHTYDYGGVKVIITIGNDVTSFIVENGPQGPKGNNGDDGENGVCEDCCKDNTVTICHKVTHSNNIPQEWVGKDYVTLTLTLSQYVHHVYEYHNGNSTQNDSWGSCDNQFEPVRLAVKDPCGNYNIGTGIDENCHYNYSNVTAYSQEEYDWYTKGGGSGEFYVPYPSKTFVLPDNKDADDYDCDNTPNI